MNRYTNSVIHMPTLAACAAFASKSDKRPALAGVRVEIDAEGATYAASNGAIFAARRVAHPEAGSRNHVRGAFTIASVDCKAFKLAKRNPWPWAFLYRDAGALVLQYEGVTQTVEPVAWPYPDWRRSVPSSVTGVLSAGIRADDLKTIERFGEALGLGPPLFCWNGADSASVIAFKGDPDAFCLVMPLNARSRADWETPAFVRRDVPETVTDSAETVS